MFPLYSLRFLLLCPSVFIRELPFSLRAPSLLSFSNPLFLILFFSHVSLHVAIYSNQNSPFDCRMLNACSRWTLKAGVRSFKAEHAGHATRKKQCNFQESCSRENAVQFSKTFEVKSMNWSLAL